jgi:hypothetical protein
MVTPLTCAQVHTLALDRGERLNKASRLHVLVQYGTVSDIQVQVMTQFTGTVSQVKLNVSISLLDEGATAKLT